MDWQRLEYCSYDSRAFVVRYDEGDNASILVDQHIVMPAHLWHPQLVWWHELLLDCNINVFDYKWWDDIL